MQKRTLARTGQTGWAHPYGQGPFSPFLYADGGDGDDSDTTDDDSGGDDDADSQDDDGTGDGDDGADKDDKPKPKPPARKGKDTDPAAELDRLRKELKTANADAAKARTTAKKSAADEARTEVMKELGKVLGLVEDDTPADPAALKKQIESATAAHRETAVELAVYRGASKYGADPDALTDSRAFLASIRDLDPSDEGFGKAVGTAIKAAVADNPKLKTAGQAPARSSGDFNGKTEKPGKDDSIDAHREARRKQRSG